MDDQPFYYIASVKHTSCEHEHIIFWGKDHCGYTPVVGDYIGAYPLSEAVRLNDGMDCVAVPVEEVRALLSAEPYFDCNGSPVRFYDQRGPVVDNTVENWSSLIGACLKEGMVRRPKPKIHRKRRNSFALDFQSEEPSIRRGEQHD